VIAFALWFAAWCAFALLLAASLVLWIEHQLPHDDDA
jgi:hypothetical protein